MKLPFIKMNGAGNDFVVLDARQRPFVLDAEQVRALASRANEVTKGCDQVVVLEPSQKADVFMRIYNADGGEVDACGNATRCIGWKLMQERRMQNIPCNDIRVATNAGVLLCRGLDKVFYKEEVDAVVEADMGAPVFAPDAIPVSGDYNEALLRGIAADLGIGSVVHATCVGMGNPHVVFFVSQLPALQQLEAAGERIKTVPLFSPHGVNLTIAEIGESVIFAYVYERGAGITKSCGTAACATAVASITFGYRKQNTDIQLQQLQRQAEDLFVRWDKATNHVLLIGPVTKEFNGMIDV